MVCTLKMARPGLLLFLLALSSAGHVPESESQSSAAILESVADDFWSFKLRENPTYATFRGVHDYDDRLEEYTHEAFDRRRDDVAALLKRLEAVKDTALTHNQRQNLLVLKADLTLFIEGYPWRRHGNLNPISFLEGIHRMPSWVSNMRYVTEEDFNKYHQRLRAIPTQINQVIDLMKEAISLNRTNHIVSMKAVPEQMEDALNQSLNESLWYSPYRDEIELTFIHPSRQYEIKKEGTELLKDQVLPAYRKLKTFLEKEYMPNTRTGYGVGSWSQGLEFYQACLRFHLSSNVTAQEVRDIGLFEVKRIKRLMEEIMKREGFRGNLSEFFNYLRKQKRTEYYDRTGEELLSSYKSIIYDRIDPKVPKILRTERIPDSTIMVRPMRIDGPSGSYGHGIFYANLRQPQNRPTFTMMALALHEASPGHHLQTAYANYQDLPEFRRHLWSTKYYAVPFNFPWHTAYTEGWGLYAEYLGEEMGCYNTSALELFGRYSSEIFRACRLVIDTGIHAFGMTFDEAREYLAQHTPISESQIRTEVARYITWPGQACAYKMGEIEILRMRRKAEETLGDKFDVRDFNEEVLKVGRVPMYVLEKEIDEWINRTTKSAQWLNQDTGSSDLLRAQLFLSIGSAFFVVTLNNFMTYISIF